MSCHFLLQGNLPDLGIELVSLMRSALADRYHCVTWEAPYVIYILHTYMYIYMGSPICIYVNEVLSTLKSICYESEAVWTYIPILHLLMFSNSRFPEYRVQFGKIILIHF